MRDIVTSISLILCFIVYGQETPTSMHGKNNTETFTVPQLRMSNDIRWYDLDVPTLHEYVPHHKSAQTRINATDFAGTGLISSWAGGVLSGYGARTLYPGLMAHESGGLGITHSFGRLSLSASISADKYGFFQETNTIYGLHGSATYKFDDNLSLTIFGSHYSHSLYHSPATLPFIEQNKYGGYLNVNVSDRFGFNMGVQRIYNNVTGQMETIPIAMPYYRFSDDIIIGIDAGYLIKDLIFDNKKHNPTIGPPKPYIPIAPRN